MRWIHLVADLYDIDFKKLDLKAEILETFFEKIITKNWLSIVGKNLHTFDKKDEITGIFALAESHLSFHTWPEFHYISLDIFACNLNQDNSQKTLKIFEEILEFFDCKKYKMQKIKRGL